MVTDVPHSQWLDKAFTFQHCKDKADPSQPCSALETRVVPNLADSEAVTYGFEEQGNQWPPAYNLPDSFNHNRIADSINLEGKSNIRYCEDGDYVRFYNHVDFDGECLAMVDTNQVANIPSGLHISLVYLNPYWLHANENGTIIGRTLTVCFVPDGQEPCVVFGDSIPDLREIGANDSIKSAHNEAFITSWLQEFSIADNPPLETDIHVAIQHDPDLASWRVCFNGENCQENAVGITELYYTCPTFLEQEGAYLISLE